MNLKINFESVQQQCRICFKNGDINIWHYKVPLKRECEENTNNCLLDEFTKKSFIEMMDIFFSSQDLLNFTTEFPLLCLQCLEDLKFCYIMYEKIKKASMQLKDMYIESLNEYIDEEHLVDVVEENEIDLTNSNLIEALEGENIVNFTHYESDNAKDSTPSKKITLDINDSFIVTQFISESLETAEKFVRNESKGNEEPPPSQRLYTVNLKAVEVKDLTRLECTQSPKISPTEPAIYVCQYCPQAFAKSDYLKTHVQKSHVCKFCTQPFIVTEDLFSHIREFHTEHKCAICHKLLSSGTNLRHHMKRVHCLKLPPKVTLIDFIKASNLENDTGENGTEILQLEGVELNNKFVWEKHDCIEILSENNVGIN